jgi:hypothetical protein
VNYEHLKGHYANSNCTGYSATQNKLYELVVGPVGIPNGTEVCVRKRGLNGLYSDPICETDSPVGTRLEIGTVTEVQ